MEYENGAWEALAEYEDGTSVSRLFEYNDRKSENRQQHEIEEWLLNRHPGCVWYSVNYLFPDEI